MKRSDLEQYLGKQVEVILFDGDRYTGYLHKTGEEQFQNDYSLYLKRKLYFLTETPENIICISSLFRTSHVKKLNRI